LTLRQCYFDFIREKLGLEDDPFAVTIPPQRAPIVFVECSQLEEMKQPGSRILLAKRGMGKTFMCMMLEISLREPEKPGNLVVGIDLPRIGAALRSRPELARGGASYLSPDILTQRIFNAYWEEMRSPQKSEAYERLRSNEAKMETVRWFYRQYPPDHLLSAHDDPQLASWLTPQDTPLEPLSTKYNPILPLEEAVRLVTDGEIGAYERVYILVDGTETLSPRALERLLEDAQALHGMHLPGLELKIFLEDTWKEQVGAIVDAIRTGEIEIIEFTGWTGERLRELLRRRVYAVRRVEYQHFTPGLEEESLDNLLRGFYADPGDESIESMITKEKSSRNSPRHAIRLARALLGKCAERYHGSQELSKEDVEKVISDYWGQEPKPV